MVGHRPLKSRSVPHSRHHSLAQYCPEPPYARPGYRTLGQYRTAHSRGVGGWGYDLSGCSAAYWPRRHPGTNPHTPSVLSPTSVPYTDPTLSTFCTGNVPAYLAASSAAEPSPGRPYRMSVPDIA
eukprot:3194605-Rhodomonas_salina.1